MHEVRLSAPDPPNFSDNASVRNPRREAFSSTSQGKRASKFSRRSRSTAMGLISFAGKFAHRFPDRLLLWSEMKIEHMV